MASQDVEESDFGGGYSDQSSGSYKGIIALDLPPGSRKNKKSHHGHLQQMKTSGAEDGKKDDSSSTTSLGHSLSLDHYRDLDWKKYEKTDVGGRKSGLDLCPVTKPLQCDPRIHYPQPINRGAKDTVLGEKLNLLKNHQKISLLQRSMEGLGKLQVRMRLPKPKKENLPLKRK